MTIAQDGPALFQRPWAWKSPQGRPVFNFKSDGRSFAQLKAVPHSGRCVL